MRGGTTIAAVAVLIYEYQAATEPAREGRDDFQVPGGRPVSKHMPQRSPPVRGGTTASADAQAAAGQGAATEPAREGRDDSRRR